VSLLLACDQSVRGFALAWTDTGPGRGWEHVHTARFDGGKVSRGDDAGAQARLWTVYGWVERHIVALNPTCIGFESYGFSAKPDTNVVELVGALKLRCMQHGIPFQTVQQSSARKRVCGPDVKIPRKGDDAKELMKKILIEHGAPATLSLDETDALVILNNMLYTSGGLPLV
jgi:Holliday junction resolvasome RuvABC endonuclease subunit